MTINISPLVSVVVVTYNSASYVVDTLESIKEQTYQNIELIVSDDCSSDESVAICKDWLAKNSNRFVRTDLVTTLKNTGTAPNFNRGIAIAKGEWIKTIAGDDALYPRLIEHYIAYIKENPDVEFLHANVVHYKENFDERSVLFTESACSYKINQKGISPQDQFEILLRTCLVAAPTVMLKASVFEKAGLFDEKYALWEDRPMWLRLTNMGIKLVYLDILGAKYRVREDSVARLKTNERLISKFLVQKNQLMYRNYLKYLPVFERSLKVLLYYNVSFADRVGLRSDSYMSRMLYNLTILPLNYAIAKIERKFI